MDRARLDRIRNYQSEEFWAILFARPAAILLLLVVADWRSVTPNRLTLASLLLMLVTSWLVAFGGPPELVAAAILVNVAQVLDNADGTLARYRQSGTSFGSYLDKMADAVSWLVLGTALSWAAYRSTGRPIHLLPGPLFGGLMLLRGYTKWVAHAQVSERTPAGAAGPGSGDAVAKAPPERTAAQWARLLLHALLQIWRFDEVDLPFWIALGLCLGRLPELCWVLFATQGIGAAVQLVRRGRTVLLLDRRA